MPPNKGRRGDTGISDGGQDSNPATPTEQQLDLLTPPSTVMTSTKQVDAQDPSHGLWGFLTSLQGMMLHQQTEITRLTLLVERQQSDIDRLSRKCNELEHVKERAEQVVNEQDERISSLCALQEQVAKLTKELADLRMFGTGYERKKPSWASVVASPGREESFDMPPKTQEEEQEVAEVEKRKLNIVISGITEQDDETPRSMHEQLQGFLEHHFCMSDIPIAGVHRAGRKKEGESRPRLLICTILDARKRAIILDSSRIYLRGTRFYVNEDRTPKQQEEWRKRIAERKKSRNGDAPA